MKTLLTVILLAISASAMAETAPDYSAIFFPKPTAEQVKAQKDAHDRKTKADAACLKSCNEIGLLTMAVNDLAATVEAGQ